MPDISSGRVVSHAWNDSDVAQLSKPNYLQEVLKASAAMDGASLNDNSQGRCLSEQCVQGYFDEVVSFREGWQRFAVDSSGLWDRFRSHGALLPAEFLAELARLQSARGLLLQRIREGTVDAVSSGWGMPGDEASLADVEAALKQLLRICRESERRFFQQQQSAVSLLQAVAGLSSAVPEVQARLRDLQTEARRELALLEGCRYGEEAQMAAVVQPWQSFFLLMMDGQRGRGQAAWVSALPELPAAECELHFSVAEGRFERWVVLQALRGLVEFGAGSEESVTAALYPERGADQQRPSAKQLEDLQLRYQEKPGAVVRAESGPATTGPRTVVPVVAGVVVQSATVHENRAADLAALESLQEQVRLAAQSAGVTAAYRELLQTLGESMQFAVAVLKARGDNRGQQADSLQQSLQLLAEAQSMLRHWQERHQPSHALPLQVQTFHWLKDAVAEDAEAILLHRYMKLQDVADSAGCSELRERLRAASARWQQLHVRSKNLSLLLQVIDDLGPEDAANGWLRVDRYFNRFVDSGGSPDDPQVRSLLSVKLPLFPELEGASELPAEGAGTATGYSEALLHLLNGIEAELDDLLRAEPETEREFSEPASPDVVMVRELLSGQRMAMVGGVVRPLAREKIERAFGLAHLEWIPASKRDRVRDLEPMIRDVNLVVLVTSLIGHKHNDLRQVCTEQGIPWVQTAKRSGYGVNQLAHAILQQASRRLGEKRAG